MKIKQLGNGGAFDYESVNSSFLIDIENNSYMLFDCGYSVYAELRKQDESKQIDLNMLKYVYISHMDDDHMGSLKTLIYYMYFVRNKKLTIISHTKVLEQLQEYLSDLNGYVENGNKIISNLYSILPISRCGHFISMGNDVSVKLVEAMHYKPSYGIFIKDKVSDISILISSDTKYCIEIAQAAKKADIVFHDYSDWDNEPNQVHCCETDFKQYGSDNHVSHKFIKYHNNKSFDNNWNTVSDLISKL